jgi:hypothetical protein
MGEKAFNFVEENRGALNRQLEVIDKYI